MLKLVFLIGLIICVLAVLAGIIITPLAFISGHYFWAIFDCLILLVNSFNVAMLWDMYSLEDWE